ncbi:MAG: hypothetical protein ABW170_03430 [Candidatus Thiodiazotropha sp. L084R]
MLTKNFYILSTLYLLLTGFHVAVSWHHDAAYITPDEISYLTQARYFSGKDTSPDVESFQKRDSELTGKKTPPKTEKWPYYHFGYSLLVSPIYWLANTQGTAYKGIMVFNSFLLSTLFLIIFFWVRLIQEIDFKTAAVIAFIVSLYPPYIIHAHIGWSENALIPGFALTCLLLARHIKVGSITAVVLFALTAGFQYTIHPRGIASAIAAIVCLIGLSIAKKDRWQTSLIGISIVLGIIIATKMVANDMAILMKAVAQGGRILLRLSSTIENELLTTISGNFLYLVLSSLGLFLLGITEGGRKIIDKGTKNLSYLFSDIYTGSLIYIFIASTLTFGSGIIFLGRTEAWHNSAQRMDFFLYGRYNEVFLSVYMALGLLGACYLYEKGIHNYTKRLNTSFLIIVFLSFAYFLRISDLHYLRSMHSYGLFPWYYMSFAIGGRLGNAVIFFAPLLWSWLILQLFLKNKMKAFAALGIYFFLLDLSLTIYVNN